MSAQQQEVLVLMDLSQFSFGALHSHEESSLPQITLVLYDSLHPMINLWCVCVCVWRGDLYGPSWLSSFLKAEAFIMTVFQPKSSLSPILLTSLLPKLEMKGSILFLVRVGLTHATFPSRFKSDQSLSRVRLFATP